MGIVAILRPDGGFETPVTAVPTTVADVTTCTVHILGLWVFNCGSSPAALSLKDKQPTPMSLPNDGFEIAPGATVWINTPFGLLAQNGFSIGASQLGLVFGSAWQ
jgi:hypothetical protein